MNLIRKKTEHLPCRATLAFLSPPPIKPYRPSQPANVRRLEPERKVTQIQTHITCLPGFTGQLAKSDRSGVWTSATLLLCCPFLWHPSLSSSLFPLRSSELAFRPRNRLRPPNLGLGLPGNPSTTFPGFFSRGPHVVHVDTRGVAA